MSMTRRNALVAGAAALPAAALAAQPPAGGRDGQPSQGMGADPFLAVCVLGGGKRQIEVCRFAQPKLKTEDVKAFCQAEIDEHEGLKADLAKLGYQPPAPATAPANGVQPAGGRGDTGAAVSVGKHTFTPAVSTVVMIDTEVVETCIANTKQALSKCEAKGQTKFEKAFIGDQLHEHMGLLDKVTTFQRHASQEMQPALKKAEATIRQHIATCEQLMEKLEMTAMKEMQGGRTGGNDR